MKTFGREPLWHLGDGWHLRQAPVTLRDWLVDPTSLTRRLVEKSQQRFQVKVLYQGWRRPLHNEAAVLNLRPHQVAFVRHVQLIGCDEKWVFARTVIPRSTLHGPLKMLTRLGEKPLGAVLFANPAIHRGTLEIARIDRGQALYNEATENGTLSQSAIWGRRSLFNLGKDALLVSEIFLPQLLKHPK